MDIKEKMALRLRECRGASGMLLREVAKAIPELSLSRYSNYEQGINMLPVDIALKIAELYKVSAAYLLAVSNEKSLDGLRNGLESQLIFLFRGMSDDHQDDLLGIANNYYNKDVPNNRAANPAPNATLPPYSLLGNDESDSWF